MIALVEQLDGFLSEVRASLSISAIRHAFVKRQFDLQSRLEFYRRLRAYLQAGIPYVTALEELQTLIARLNKRDPKLRIIDDVVKSCKSGTRFAKAMSRWVPAQDAMLLQAGEAQDGLATTMTYIIEVSEKQFQTQKAVKAQLAGPFLKMGLVAVLFGAFNTLLLPQILNTLPAEFIGPTGRDMQTVSGIVTEGTIPALLLVAIAFYLYRQSLPTLTGPLRQALDAFFPWSLYRIQTGTVMLITVVGFMKAGVPFDAALASIAKNSNAYLRWHLERAKSAMSSGRTIGKALDTGLLPLEVIVDIELYARLMEDQFQQAIELVATNALDETLERVKSLATKLNGLSLGLITFAVVYFIIGIMGIGFEASDAVNNSMNSR